MHCHSLRCVGFTFAAAVAALAVVSAQTQSGGDPQGFKFKSGVELTNVTATVTDATGRFVSGLRL